MLCKFKSMFNVGGLYNVSIKTVDSSTRKRTLSNSQQTYTNGSQQHQFFANSCVTVQESRLNIQ